MYGRGGTPFTPFAGMLQVRAAGTERLWEQHLLRLCSDLENKQPAAPQGVAQALTCSFTLPQSLCGLIRQFALEALVVPPDSPTAPSEVARHMPALLKMLRSLKFCDDASAEPRTRVRSRSQALGTFACAA